MGFTGVITHFGCWENTRKACFSRVLPTSRVGYHAGKPIESVVYCINNSYQIFQMASTFYKLFTIEIETWTPYAVEKEIHAGTPLINNF